MKKFFGLIFGLITLMNSNQLNAQCDAVTVEVIAMNPQTGQQNNFGVRVRLSQIYSQDVTVNGTIYKEGGQYVDGWTLTIIAGNLTAETSSDYYQTDPASNADASISSVSPCPDFIDIYTLFDNKFKNMGSFHNQILLDVHNNINFGIINDYVEAVNLLRDYTKNQYNLNEQNYLGNNIDASEKNQMFEDYKYFVNYSDFHQKLLATSGSSSIDVSLSNLNTIPVDLTNKQLIQNISNLIKANLNGSIIHSNYEYELRGYADQWLQINSVNESSLGAQISGIILSIGLKSYQWWSENSVILYDEEISFINHFETIGKNAGPNINSNLKNHLLPVPVGMDIAGAFIGSIGSAVAQYSVKGAINMDMVYAGALSGAVLGSTGIVGRVGRWLSSIF